MGARFVTAIAIGGGVAAAACGTKTPSSFEEKAVARAHAKEAELGTRIRRVDSVACDDEGWTYLERPVTGCSLRVELVAQNGSRVIGRDIEIFVCGVLDEAGRLRETACTPGIQVPTIVIQTHRR